MTLNPQALTEAARALHESCSNQDILGYLDFKVDCDVLAQAAVSAYLSALPPINEGIVKRLRELSPGVDQIFRSVETLSSMLEERAPVEITGSDVGQALLEAADIIERLSRERPE